MRGIAPIVLRQLQLFACKTPYTVRTVLPTASNRTRICPVIFIARWSLYPGITRPRAKQNTKKKIDERCKIKRNSRSPSLHGAHLLRLNTLELLHPLQRASRTAKLLIFDNNFLDLLLSPLLIIAVEELFFSYIDSCNGFLFLVLHITITNPRPCLQLQRVSITIT